MPPQRTDRDRHGLPEDVERTLLSATSGQRTFQPAIAGDQGTAAFAGVLIDDAADLDWPTVDAGRYGPYRMVQRRSSVSLTAVGGGG